MQSLESSVVMRSSVVGNLRADNFKLQPCKTPVFVCSSRNLAYRRLFLAVKKLAQMHRGHLAGTTCDGIMRLGTWIQHMKLATVKDPTSQLRTL